MQSIRVRIHPHQVVLDKADYLPSVLSHLRYDIALLYLEQSHYDLDLAVQAYLADEQWEKDHPFEGPSKGVKSGQKPRTRMIGMQTGLTGQL